MVRRVQAFLLGLSCLVLLSGCGRQLPRLVPVQGTVRINGQPLPKASVTFVPQLDKFGAESNSTAVTDENGRFTLTCAFKGQPGAVVGNHVILITEPPLPEELRNSRDVREMASHRQKLGNRPIPPVYGSVSRSPLKVEIKEGQEEVKLELTR
ncbi:MAG: hypothetical protein ACYC3I_09145 [Gemmataceae bacterium]